MVFGKCLVISVDANDWVIIILYVFYCRVLFIFVFDSIFVLRAGDNYSSNEHEENQSCGARAVQVTASRTAGGDFRLFSINRAFAKTGFESWRPDDDDKFRQLVVYLLEAGDLLPVMYISVPFEKMWLVALKSVPTACSSVLSSSGRTGCGLTVRIHSQLLWFPRRSVWYLKNTALTRT